MGKEEASGVVGGGATDNEEDVITVSVSSSASGDGTADSALRLEERAWVSAVGSFDVFSSGDDGLAASARFMSRLLV